MCVEKYYVCHSKVINKPHRIYLSDKHNKATSNSSVFKLGPDILHCFKNTGYNCDTGSNYLLQTVLVETRDLLCKSESFSFLNKIAFNHYFRNYIKIRITNNSGQICVVKYGSGRISTI